MMELKEAIIHAQQVAEGCGVDGRDCAYQHYKLVDWLEELQTYRSLGTVEEIKLFKDEIENRFLLWVEKHYGISGGKLMALLKAQEAGRLVELSTPMLPMMEGDEPDDTDVYCPRCGHNLSGGWSKEHPDEWKLCQCPNCGQSIDYCKVMSRRETEATVAGGGENG